MNTVSREDWHLTPVDPDPDFNPEHNQRVIDGVIRKTNLLRQRKQKEFEDGARERAAAVAKYIEGVKMGGAVAKVKDYFGRRHLAYLRGQEFLKALKNEAGQKNPLHATQPG